MLNFLTYAVQAVSPQDLPEKEFQKFPYRIPFFRLLFFQPVSVFMTILPLSILSVRPSANTWLSGKQAIMSITAKKAEKHLFIIRKDTVLELCEAFNDKFFILNLPLK